MKNIKTYDIFLESEANHGISGESHVIQHHYSIYDWFEDLKGFQWRRTQIPLSEASLRHWSEHFIGSGIFDKIESHVDKIIQSVSKVDIDYIGDRMLDIFDNYPDIDNHIHRCVLYGDLEKRNEPVRRRYSGIMPISEKSNNKLDIIVHIIKEIVYPTLSIMSFGKRIDIRMSDESQFVTDVKYQCINFNIEDYLRGRHNILATMYVDQKRLYNIDNIIELYQPGVYINMKDDSKIWLDKLEREIDDILPSILPDFDYKEVIFDHSRWDRQFAGVGNVSDYTLRILLNI